MFQGRSVFVLIFLFSGWATAKNAESIPGEYIVKLKSRRSANAVQEISAQSQATKWLSKKANLLFVKRADVETQSFSTQALQAMNDVEYVEPNYIYYALKTPNDPQLGDLWGMANVGQVAPGGEKGTSGFDINALKAWDITTGSSDMVVAVIDTGVDYTLPDLAGNIWVNEKEKNGQSGVDDDNNGFIDDVYGYDFANEDNDPKDDHGHGSHVAGTIGARGDDGFGIVGVNWQVRIMSLKFLTATGGGSLEAAIKAIDYAVKNGAKILSNSWGGGPYSQALEDVIRSANDKGVLFVAAAGNSHTNNDDNPTFPASYNLPNIISVAAINNNGALASFSCFGKKSVDVGAPGVKILSSTPKGYESWSGTSMAAPHVSGVAALVWAHEPNLTMEQLRERLVTTARPISSLKNRTKTGGLIDAYFALINEKPPLDPNDPDNWKKVSKSISTPHPYADQSKTDYLIEARGASSISVYFEKFETEKGYDKVSFIDKAGNVVGVWSGSHGSEYSPEIPGDQVTLRFETDKTVIKYGFDVTHVSYKGELSKRRKKIRRPTQLTSL